LDYLAREALPDVDVDMVVRFNITQSSLVFELRGRVRRSHRGSCSLRGVSPTIPPGRNDTASVPASSLGNSGPRPPYLPIGGRGRGTGTALHPGGDPGVLSGKRVSVRLSPAQWLGP